MAEKISGRLGIAAEFLAEQLAGKEKPVMEIEEAARARGINRSTLQRARTALHVKTRKGSDAWYVSLPENVREQFTISSAASKRKTSANTTYQISTDWTKIAISEEGANDSKSGSPGLRVKVGDYEVEADTGFPTEKLIEILRELGGEIPC